MNKKVLIATGLALLFGLSSFEAVAYLKPDAKPNIGSTVELMKGKAAKKGKGAKVAAFKSCGAYMYNKDGKCVDARAKK